MQNITSVIELKNAIQQLEVEQAIDERLLKEQFYMTYQSLKPINLLRNAIYEITKSPDLKDSVLGTAAGLVTGYISRKIALIGAPSNLIRRLLGTVLQLGVTNVVIQNPEMIKSFGQYIFQHIFHKKRNEF